MADSVKRTWRIIRGYLYEKTFSKMLFMLFSRTFMMFGIGLITVPALFLLFYDALLEGDILTVCGGIAIFCIYVVWVIWGDKNRMLKYNRLFFLSEIRLHKSYVEKLTHIPYEVWRKEYDIGKAANLIEDGTDEVMMRFRDVLSLIFKGAAVALINVWIFVISNIYAVLAIDLAIVAEYFLSSCLSRKSAACEKAMFDAESEYKNLQRIFLENAEDYAMAGLGDYWKEKILRNTGEKYEIGKKSVNWSSLLQSGMDFIDLLMYLCMFLYGLMFQNSMLSPLVIIMAYEMIKDVTEDFFNSVGKIRKKIYAIEEFEKIDRLAAEADAGVNGDRVEAVAGTAETAERAEAATGTAVADVEVDAGTDEAADKDLHEIRLTGVDVEVDGKKLLTDLNLAIKSGSKVMIVGDNGSGKTVLLKTILGIYRPAKGEVRYGNMPAEKLRFESGNNWLAYDPVERMLFPATVAENVNMYTDGKGYGAGELGCRLRELLGGEYDVGEEIQDALNRFSLGQIDTLCLLRTEKADGNIMVLDEPLAHADKEIFRRIWRELMESNRTVIAAEHEFDEIAAEFNPVVVWMEEGKIKMVGEYTDLMKQNEAFSKWRKAR